MSARPLPTAGYRLNQVVAIRQRQELLGKSERPDDQGREITFAWDWQIAEPGRMEVLFGVLVGDTASVPEEIEVKLVGEFEFRGIEDPADLRRFAELNAVALLLPYIRESVSSLSGRGPFGPHFLPTLNVHALAEGFDPERATGRGQLEADPTLIRTPESVEPG